MAERRHVSNDGRQPKLRCALYTRKSSEEGLEQDFNSLDAQREACEAFVVSQKREGWVLLPELYDDGGYSGGTLERPAFQRLLADVGAGKVDVVVVYKVDRLTRSLSDFAKIVEVFDKNGVSFVSVTQQFNTTSSMGRLTLNILLSFAQFEREVTGERIRDKIAASKKKGMWMGGQPPLGYDVKDRKLVVNTARGRDSPAHLPALSRTEVGPAAQGRPGCAGNRQQGPDGIGRQCLRQQAAGAWCSLSHAAEPDLSRRDRPQGQELSGTNTTPSLTSASGTRSRPFSAPTGSNGLMAAATTGRACWPAFCLTRRASG